MYLKLKGRRVSRPVLARMLVDIPALCGIITEPCQYMITSHALGAAECGSLLDAALAVLE